MKRSGAGPERWAGPLIKRLRAMSRRQTRVNELLKREISGVIQRDFEFTDSLVTVTGVEVTPDLKEAKVFVGVFGGNVDWVMGRLNGDHGAIQKKVMKRVILKSCLLYTSDAADE